MKFYPKANLYKASNVTFNCSTHEAYSYGWWRFTEVINGELVFNSYVFSNTTRRHQWKVRLLLRDLGMAIAHEIEAPQGLQNLNSAIELYQQYIGELNKQIEKPKSKAAKNAERQERIRFYEQKIKLVRSLIKHQQRKAA